MKFKVGEKVRIKKMTQEECFCHNLGNSVGYNDAMIQYEGQTHKITNVNEDFEEYEITFPEKGNRRNYWYYKEE